MKTIDSNVINVVNQSFFFLEDEWGYTKTESYHYSRSIFTRSNYVITYINKLFQKKIEIALLVNSSNIEIEIARLRDDGIFKYEDEDYYLSYYKLYYLLEPPIYEPMLYQAALHDRIKAIEDAGEFIMRFKNVLYSEQWFDIDKMKQRYADYYHIKWGVDLRSQKNIEPVSDIIKKKLFLLKNKGYYLKQDSKNVPFYERNGWWVIYSNGKKDVSISQIDMRDYLYYNIDINGDKQTLYFPDYESADKLADHIAHIIKEAL